MPPPHPYQMPHGHVSAAAMAAAAAAWPHGLPPYAYPNAHQAYRPATRWVLTPEDTELLENVFKATPFPSRQVHQELSECLQVRLRQVQAWFQNKRQRVKHGTESKTCSVEPAAMSLPPDDAPPTVKDAPPTVKDAPPTVKDAPPTVKDDDEGETSVSKAVNAASAAAAAAKAAAEVAEAAAASAMAEAEAARSKARG